VDDRRHASAQLHRVPYGARLQVDEGDEGQARPAPVPSGTRTPSRSSPKSTASSRFEDLVDGALDASKQVDEVDRHRPAAWSIDWRTSAARPTCVRVVIMDGKGKIAKLAACDGERATCCRWTPSLSVDDGRQGQGRRRRGAYPDAKAPRPRDITGGLPRVAELFEARKPEGRGDHRRDRRPHRVRQATTRTSAAIDRSTAE